MIRSDQILNTVSMIQKENLDVRAVTLGVNLLDCRSTDVDETCARMKGKIKRYAADMVTTWDAVGEKDAFPVVNKRIAVTPMADVGAGLGRGDFVKLAKALDAAATEVGCDLIGGFSANVEKGISPSERELIAAIPEALSVTGRVCGSVNVGSTRYGINMDAVVLLGIREVRCLAMAATAFEMFVGKSDRHSLVRRALWRHAVYTAAVGRSVARRVPGIKDDEGFVAGLMHDVGKSIALGVAQQDYMEAIETAEASGASLYETELEMLSFTHADLGAAALTRNFSGQIQKGLKPG